jgi:thiol-disulfide isomerase/thioredoxin
MCRHWKSIASSALLSGLWGGLVSAMISSRMTLFSTVALAALWGGLVFTLSGCGRSTDPSLENPASFSNQKSGSKSGQGGGGSENDPSFRVPDGDSVKILAFVKGLASQKYQPSSQQDANEYTLKLQRAIIRAGDKILAQKADDATLKEALTRKIVGQIGLAVSGLDDAPEQILAEVQRLRGDARPVVAEVANQYWLAVRALNVNSLPPADQEKLREEAIEWVRVNGFSDDSLRDAVLVADQLTKANQIEAAAGHYEHLVEAIQQSPEKETRGKLITQWQGKAAQLRLPGSKLELEGTLLDGSQLDWESYRGKVVLVDFWATWCGPCIAEVPNVKENYRKYHDRGFDVLGISLDKDRKPLVNFVNRESIPWKQMYEDSSGKGSGWQHSMAVKYGVTAIPAAILVDQQGKVVSMNARGDELSRLLSELLSPSAK